MSKAMAAAGGVILAAAGVGFYAQYQANVALRREFAAMRDEVRAANLRAAAAPVTAPASAATSQPATAIEAALPAAPGATVTSSEVTKLREEMVALRKSTSALVQLAQTAEAAKELAKNSESVATKLLPAAQLKNAGRATPEAGIETGLWAAVGGDVDMLTSSLTFTDTARTKADAWFATLSDATRQQYGSPEKVIALMIARDAAGLAGMQVIGQKEIAADNVGLRVRIASAEGQTKDETFLMRRNTDGWKMVLPDSVVEKFARRIGGGK